MQCLKNLNQKPPCRFSFYPWNSLERTRKGIFLNERKGICFLGNKTFLFINLFPVPHEIGEQHCLEHKRRARRILDRDSKIWARDTAYLLSLLSIKIAVVLESRERVRIARHFGLQKQGTLIN